MEDGHMDNVVGTKFRELSLTDKLDLIKKITSLEEGDVQFLKDSAQSLGFDNVNRMIENAIGVFPVPMGIATNFLINSTDYLIPMAVEEPSVIAATSKAAKIARLAGGFHAEADDSLMIGQIQVIPNGKSYEAISAEILKKTDEFHRIAGSKTKSSSVEKIEIRTVEDESQLGMGTMIIVELIINTHDAMGANVVNAMCEAVGQAIESITGCTTILKILSNYSVRRLVRCRATFPKNEVGGGAIVERILYAYAFAYSDVYRAVTHNKGIMNGIDAVALATGQDFRAIEAAAHAYASKGGRYRSLSRWWRDENGDLVGELEMPMAVGIVGGVTKVHKMAATSLKILRVYSSQELAIVIASVGLAQNFAALLALASEGIQKGHMKLHSRNIAYMAGARGDMIDILSERLVKEDKVTLSRAKELLVKLSHDGYSND
ncbi:MAG TPA: hydroxymethylglutaryl-CoA reductase, degradative [Nitrososphaeraceae archaeon]|nr:hydroxymethylglutaryl-CoA reductase, degradative [Nitrososphaeraceae archaeon]